MSAGENQSDTLAVDGAEKYPEVCCTRDPNNVYFNAKLILEFKNENSSEQPLVKLSDELAEAIKLLLKCKISVYLKNEKSKTPVFPKATNTSYSKEEILDHLISINRSIGLETDNDGLRNDLYDRSSITISPRPLKEQVLEEEECLLENHMQSHSFNAYDILKTNSDEIEIKDEYLTSISERDRFVSVLNTNENIFFVNLIGVKQPCLASNEVIALGNQILRPIIFQYILQSSITVYVKENKDSNIVKVDLNEPGKLNGKEFEIKLNSNKHFGIEDLKMGSVRGFSDKDARRSILKVEIKRKEKDGKLNLIDYALTHDHLMLVRYLSRFPWDLKELKSEGKSSIGIAFEKKGTYHISAMFGLPFEDPFEGNVPSRVIELLNETCIDNGSTPLILSAIKRDTEKISLLLNLGVNVNETDKISQSAVDHSWEREDYYSVLKLLKADSFIPKECTAANIKEDLDYGPELKEFLSDREELHKEIECGKYDKFNELSKKQTSKWYLNHNEDPNQNNISVLSTAVKKNRWDVYAFVSSTGVEFCFPEEEKEFEDFYKLYKGEIENEKKKYYFDAKNSHLIRLVAKSKIYGEYLKGKTIIDEFYEQLDQSPFTSVILKVLQYVYNLKIIFDFFSYNTKNMDPEDTSNTKGKTDYENGIIKIGAKICDQSGRTKSHVLGTLAQELTHLAISHLYRNGCKPYEKEHENEKKFEEISEKVLKKVCESIAINTINDLYNSLDKKDEIYNKKLNSLQQIINNEIRDSIGIPTNSSEIATVYDERFVKDVIENKKLIELDDIIKAVYTNYTQSHWHLELITRIPHIMAQFGFEEGKKIVNNQVPELLQYYEENVIRVGDKFLKEQRHMKHTVTISDFNKYIGEIKSLELRKIRFLDSDVIPSKCSEKLCLVKTSSIQLCSIYFYQVFSKKYGIQFQQRCLFLKLNYFENHRNKLLNMLKYNLVPCTMVLISDTAILCDHEYLANVLKNIGVKVFLIVNKNHDISEALKTMTESVIETSAAMEAVTQWKTREEFMNHDIDCEIINYKWSSLEPASKEYLMNKTFNFQGKRMCLKSFFGKDSELLHSELLDPDALAMLVENHDIAIGNNKKEASSKEYDDDYYIDRRFRKQTICFDILKDEVKILLFISNATKKDLISLGASENQIQEWRTEEKKLKRGKRIICLKDVSVETYQNIFIQMKELPIHWLDLQNKYMVCKNTNGDLSELNDFVQREITIEYKGELEFLSANDGEKIIILADDAGMGKSTVLTKLTKEKERDFWVVRFNMIDYVTKLKEINFGENEKEKAIDFVASLLDFKNPFETCIFKQCCKHFKKIVMIFDGFDEIYPDYKEHLVKLLKALKESSIAQLWITTRFHDKSFLEKGLKSVAYTLNHWKRDDQLKFLNKFWKKKLKFVDVENDANALKKIHSKVHYLEWMKSAGDENKDLMNSILEYSSHSETTAEKVEEALVKARKHIDSLNFSPYAEVLLHQLNITLNDDEGKFSFVPLHIVMLANVVFEYNFKMPQDFNLNDLYDCFVQGKFNIYYEKIKFENENFEDIRNLCENFIQKAHQIEAMKVFLNDDESFPKKYFQPNSKNANVLMIQIGLLVPSHDGYQFIHRTFAEYFFSEGLIENFGNAHVQRVWLKKVLRNNNFTVVRHFINNRCEKKKLSIEFDIELIEAEKFFGHNKEIGTNLHRLAFEGHASIIGLFFDNFPDKVCEIISVVDSNKSNILHCACQKGSSKVVEKILMFAIEHLNKENIEKLILQKDRRGRLPFHIAVWNSDFEIVELLFQHVEDKFGSEWVKTNIILKTDSFGSALHIATMKGNSEMIKYLLDKLENDSKSLKNIFTSTNNKGNTILHIAAYRGHNSLTIELLNFGKSILYDQRMEEFILLSNKFGFSFLHSAILNDNIEIVKIFREFYEKKYLGKVVFSKLLEAKDKTGESVLHKCVVRNCFETLHDLIDFSYCVFSPDSVMDFLMATNDNKFTVVHNAASFSSCDCFIKVFDLYRGLLDEKMFENFLITKNKFGRNILHTVASRGDSGIVNKLLNENIPKTLIIGTGLDSETILHKASIKGNIHIFEDFVEFVQEKLTEREFTDLLYKVNRHKKNCFEAGIERHPEKSEIFRKLALHLSTRI